MNWLKLHHGTPFDPKWAVVAKRAGVTRCAVVAVWLALLDHASQNTPRGSLERLDLEMIGVSLDLETDQVQAIVTAMSERGLVTDETVTNWGKRQTGTSTERVRRFRERENAGVTVTETPDETPAPLRNADETIDKSRAEENRLDQKDAAAPTRDPACELIAAFDDARAKTFGEAQARPWPDGQDATTARRWLEAGCDLETARAVFLSKMAGMNARGKSPPNTLSYFDQPIANALAASKQPMPEGNANDDPLHIPDKFKRRKPDSFEAAIAAGRSLMD